MTKKRILNYWLKNSYSRLENISFIFLAVFSYRIAEGNRWWPAAVFLFITFVSIFIATPYNKIEEMWTKQE